MKKNTILLISLFSILVCPRAFAGFGDTLPQNLFLLDVAYLQSSVTHRWDDRAKLGNLQEDIEMYEPTGELQGKIKAPAENNMYVLLTTLFYGVTDDFTVGLIFPYILYSRTNLNLTWEPGDYNAGLGRRYSESDFWEWAESMGQGRPKDAKRRGLPGDLMIGTRYRIYRDKEYQISMMGYVDTRTGIEADPEMLGSSGSTGYAMGTNGDVGAFVSLDRMFTEDPYKRLTLSANILYEYSHWRTLETPAGKNDPLLMTYAPYVGEHHRIKPYDFWGFTLGFAVILMYGPTETTWMTEDNPELQASLPPFWTISSTWNHKRYSAADYRSNSPQWDKDQEEIWGPGFKNTISFRTEFNFMRFGFPGGIYAKHDNQELVISQNLRPVISNGLGLQLFFTF